jgi:subtilisin-like proprotein convertase family protein
MKSLLFYAFLLIIVACKGGDSKSVVNGPSGAATSGTDPLAPYMWHLSNTGAAYVNGAVPVSGKNINLGSVHNSATGRGVKVVISDTSVSLDHPDLSANADTSLSKDYRLPDPYYGDPLTIGTPQSHGTAVASLALAKKNNGVGGFGVAPDATLIGNNFLTSDQDLPKMFDQTTLEGHPGIFNYSYGYKACKVIVGGGATYWMYLRAGNIGDEHIYVTSAGNNFASYKSDCGGGQIYYFGNSNFDQTKADPYLIVVASTNASGTRASYSTPGANIWVSAPGGDNGLGIMTADLVGCTSGLSLGGAIAFDKSSSSKNPNCAFYSAGMGTSYAAPVVTGAIAVLREVNPDLSWRDIKHILAKTATKIDPTATSTSHPWNENLTGHTYQQGWVTNAASYPFHPWYGFGQINLSAAKTLAEYPDFDLFELKTTDSMADTNTYSTGTISLNVPDNSSVGVSSTINVNAHHLVIEYVQVTVSVTHANPADLGIELTSPSGTTTKLMNINSGLIGTSFVDVKLGAAAFYGERSRGTWTLKVIDGATGSTGVLTSWSISILGNRGGALADTTAPSPASAFSKSGANLIWTASPSGDLARHELCITPTSLVASACIDGDWRPVVGTSLALSKFVYRGYLAPITSGVNYTAKIRAVDTSENASAVISTSWTQP